MLRRVCGVHFFAGIYRFAVRLDRKDRLADVVHHGVDADLRLEHRHAHAGDIIRGKRLCVAGQTLDIDLLLPVRVTERHFAVLLQRILAFHVVIDAGLLAQPKLVFPELRRVGQLGLLAAAAEDQLRVAPHGVVGAVVAVVAGRQLAAGHGVPVVAAFQLQRLRAAGDIDLDMAAGIRIDQLVRAGLIHGHAVGVDDKLRRVLFDRGRVGIELRLVLHILVVPVVADADIRRQLLGVHAGDVIDRVGVRLHAEALLVDLRLAVYIGRERGQLVELVQIERILRDPVLLDAVCRVVQADAVIEGELARPVHVGQVFPGLAALPDRQRRVAPLGIGGEICVGVVAGRRTVGLVDQLQLLRALGNVHADMAAVRRVKQLALVNLHAVGVDLKLAAAIDRVLASTLLLPRPELGELHADIAVEFHGVQAGDIVNDRCVRCNAEALFKQNRCRRVAVHVDARAGITRLLRAGIARRVAVPRIFGAVVLLHAESRAVRIVIMLRAHPFHVGKDQLLRILFQNQQRVAPLGVGGEIRVGIVAGRRAVGLVDQLQLLCTFGNVHADMAAVRRVEQLAPVDLHAVGVDLELAAALGIRLHVAAGLLPRLELGEFHADIAFKFHGVQAGNIVNDRRVRRDAEAFFKQNGRSRIAVHVDAGAGVARLLRAGIARRVAVPWIFGAVVFLHAESRAVRVVIVLRAHPFQVREIHAVSVCRGRPPDSGICLCVGCHAERRYHAQQQRRSQQERSDPFPILLHAFPFLFTYFSYRTTEAQLTPPAAPPR